MRAFITGITGFVGSHLAQHLRSTGADVFGIALPPQQGLPAGVPEGCRVVWGDLRNAESVAEILRLYEPSHVFHLAALIGGAQDDYAGFYETNVLATLRLLDAVRRLEHVPRVLVASSSAVYGSPGQSPTDEAQPYRPLTHYAASKAAQELVAVQYHLAHGIPTIRTRTFNLVGPGQPAALVASDLARQVARAERGGDRTLRVGNLTPRRDYTDVRDAVQAYALLAEMGRAGEVYNVCTGESRSVGECAQILIALARVSLRLVVEQQRVRTVEIPEQRGDPSRLKAVAQWAPKISLEASLRDLLDDWRARESEARTL